MKIRCAEERDLGALQELVRQLGYAVGLEVLRERMGEYRGMVLVAEEGEVLGFAALQMCPQFHSEERHLRVISLAVEERWRRRGVGQSLLEEAERLAREWGCSVVELTSAAHRKEAGPFYRKMGYGDGKKLYFRKELL